MALCSWLLRRWHDDMVWWCAAMALMWWSVIVWCWCGGTNSCMMVVRWCTWLFDTRDVSGRFSIHLHMRRNKNHRYSQNMWPRFEQIRSTTILSIFYWSKWLINCRIARSLWQLVCTLKQTTSKLYFRWPLHTKHRHPQQITCYSPIIRKHVRQLWWFGLKTTSYYCSRERFFPIYIL